MHYHLSSPQKLVSVSGGSDAESVFGNYVQFHIDIDRVTQWQTESYPNGVQDLPFKDILRRGGRCELLQSTDKKKVAIYWKANQVLRHFQWRPIDEAKDEKVTEKASAGTKLKGLFRKSKDESVDIASSGDTTSSNITSAGVNLALLEFRLQTPVGKVRLTKGHDTATFKEAGGGLTGGKIVLPICLQ